MTVQSLSFLHSLMVPVTRACGIHCQYCTFRQDDNHVMSFDEIETSIRRYYNTGIMEVLIESGQALDKIGGVRKQWEDQGYATFAHYLRDIGQLVLENHLLPSLDVGPLTFSEVETVSSSIASLTVMLENVNTALAKTIQPGKSIDAKIETLSDAGMLQIPVHTGILIGIGETLTDLIAAIDAIAELHGKYRHVQSVSVQYAAAVKGTAFQSFQPEDLVALIRHTKKIMPDVAVSVPVTSPAFWIEAVHEGIDDLGRVFEGKDGIDWDRDYPKITEIVKILARKGLSMKPRFPAFPGSFSLLQRSDKLWAVCQEWLNKNDYAYYRTGG